jgi:thioesterase domain-containing protein
LEEMARCYVKEVRAFQPTGPYYLGGYCFGGNVAYEMARQLETQGERVGMVALLDSAPSNAGYESVRWWKLNFPLRFGRNLAYWLGDFRRLEPAARRRFVKRKISVWARKAKAALGLRSTPSAEVDLDEVIDVSHFPERELKLWQAHLQALVTHIEQPYDGPVTLLRTRGQPLFCSLEPDFCWRALAPRLGIRLVPGSHEEVFMEPHVRTLARELLAILAAAASSQPSDSPRSTETATTL